MLILVDMNRGDQDLYISTKYRILGPLLKKIYGVYNNPLVRFDRLSKNREEEEEEEEENEQH